MVGAYVRISVVERPIMVRGVLGSIPNGGPVK